MFHKNKIKVAAMHNKFHSFPICPIQKLTFMKYNANNKLSVILFGDWDLFNYQGGGGGERIKNVQEQKVNVSERVLTLVLFVKTNLQRLKIGEM